MSEPLFHTSCPSCGAPVHVHSATAVTVVCSYCNSMLVRQDNGLHDTGRDSALLTDFSPLQIGTTGRFRFATQGFTLIGRLQARYEDGMWNEWYVRFDDGSMGWLSEAGDLYVLLHEVSVPNAPDFGDIEAGRTTLNFNKRFVASDVRHIVLENAAAQGELPFRLPEKMENKVADFRCEGAFLTLDYATTPPAAFLGRTIQFSDLILDNIKDEHQIRQQAGSLKGTRHSENCPNCGSPIQWISGVTQTVICPSCGSDLDLSEGKAALRTAHFMRQAQDTGLTLKIGTTGVIRGHKYTVIGAVRYEEIDGIDALKFINGGKGYAVPQGWWFEYLLYAPLKGFLWLVETPEDGWFISQTLTEFPRLNAHNEVHGLEKLYYYGGRVSYAAGAFYWHIRAGDVNHYTDYRQGNTKICAELSPNELAFSRSTPMTAAELQAFGISSRAAKIGSVLNATPLAEAANVAMRTWAIAIFIIINAPAWLMMSGDDLPFSLFMSGILIAILWTAGREDDD